VVLVAPHMPAEIGGQPFYALCLGARHKLSSEPC
jgi:hypothetical protein